MKVLMVGFVAAALVFVGAQSDEAALKKERAKLKGSWKILRFETPEGVQDAFKDAVVSFDEAGALELQKGGETKKAKYKVEPGVTPSQIDIVTDDGPKMQGIYKLEKEQLLIAVTEDQTAARPTEFKVKAGEKTVVVTLEKQK